MKFNKVETCLAKEYIIQKKLYNLNEEGYHLVSACAIGNLMYLFLEKEYK